MLRVKEIAARLDVAPKTVRRWITEGRLRGILLGGTKSGYRIRESELQRFLTERER